MIIRLNRPAPSGYVNTSRIKKAQGSRASGLTELEGVGTKTTGVIRCDQPRVLDLKARGGRRLESVPDDILDEVLARFIPIFEG